MFCLSILVGLQMTLLSALIGFIAGVASASALPPRTFVGTFGPLLVALAVAAILGKLQ